MTDVPEHLLRRSRERRSALGPGGGEESGAAPAASGDDATPAAPAQAAAPAKAAPAKAAAPAPAAPPPPPPPPPPYVVAAQSRPKVPFWALPVLALLPVWALVYAGGLTEPGEELDPVLAEGEQIYNQCAGCHGAQGQGGSGRPLDEVLLTFPDPADHIAWVRDGSPDAGTPYGDPDRPGGQQISQDGWPAMPGFGEGTAAALTEEQIIAVVRYEREVLAGEEEPVLAEGTAAEAGAGEGATDEAVPPAAEAEAEGADTDGGAGSNVGDQAETRTDEGTGTTGEE